MRSRTHLDHDKPMHTAMGHGSAGFTTPRNEGLAARDARPVHVVTRGNVDGIVASALCLAAHPDARVSYVASATHAADVLRKDLGSRRFLVADLGITPRLARVLNAKAHTAQDVVLIDHHQQTIDHRDALRAHVDVAYASGGSAASVALPHLAAEGRLQPLPVHETLCAIADLVEFGASPHLPAAIARHGLERLHDEAQQLDFAWRLSVEDDRFRLGTARRLARGDLPSAVPEVRARYLQVLRENRWARARERVRSRMRQRAGVALLDFGRHRTSLLGFGARALTSVAHEEGARVAILIQRRGREACIAVRAVRATPVNLGRYVESFTQVHGVAGGGHPTSAGARIPAASVATFVDGLCAVV